MKTNHSKTAISAYLLCLFTALPLFSQISIEGKITDNGAAFLGSGAEPVKGALVTLEDKNNPEHTYSDITDEDGNYSIVLVNVDDNFDGRPSDFQLFQNYPNPFNPGTRISWNSPQSGHMTIEIYNVLGRKINTVFEGFASAGFGSAIWEGTDQTGRGVPAGVYIYSLKTESTRESRKMLLLDGNQSAAPAALKLSSGKEDHSAVLKTSCGTYILTVEGDDIEDFTHDDLQLSESMTHDITVNRIMTGNDGRVYRTVKIGDQWWMAENLRETEYRNGDALPHIAGNTDWTNLDIGAYCAYENDEDNAEIYGYLYNWLAVDDARNIAPEGWKVPADADWKALELFLGMPLYDVNNDGWRGDAEGGLTKEAGTDLWQAPNEAASNETGFSALPGGLRLNSTGEFDNLHTDAQFWAFTEADEDDAWRRNVNHQEAGIGRRSRNKLYGFSLRLIKDTNAGTMTGNDGRVYRTVRIGDQVWMAENLRETQYRNGDIIPNVTHIDDWETLDTGARSAYRNDESYAEQYGYLYNWHAVDDERSIAPEGWRVAADDDWKQLEIYSGMSEADADATGERGSVANAGGKLKAAGTVEHGTGLWLSPNTGAADEWGFSALPGGFLFSTGTWFDYSGKSSAFWTSTEYDEDKAFYRGLFWNHAGINRSGNLSRQDGFSVRLIMD